LFFCILTQCQKYAEIGLLIQHFTGYVIRRLSACTRVPHREGKLRLSLHCHSKPTRRLRKTKRATSGARHKTLTTKPSFTTLPFWLRALCTRVVQLFTLLAACPLYESGSAVFPSGCVPSVREWFGCLPFWLRALCTRVVRLFDFKGVNGRRTFGVVFPIPSRELRIHCSDSEWGILQILVNLFGHCTHLECKMELEVKHNIGENGSYNKCFSGFSLARSRALYHRAIMAPMLTDSGEKLRSETLFLYFFSIQTYVTTSLVCTCKGFFQTSAR